MFNYFNSDGLLEHNFVLDYYSFGDFNELVHVQRNQEKTGFQCVTCNVITDNPMEPP